MKTEMFEHVKEAAERIAGHANRTPVMTSSTLDRLTGAKVFFKCENFQKVGAFKFRGAFNAIGKLSEEQKAKGIVTYSSGNHAQAVALVGRTLNLKTVIVMPENAPEIKRKATEAYGAEVVYYDPAKADRAEIATALQAENGYAMIPPFDHLDVVAGQGTAALELFEEVGRLDCLLVPFERKRSTRSKILRPSPTGPEPPPWEKLRFPSCSNMRTTSPPFPRSRSWRLSGFYSTG